MIWSINKNRYEDQIIELQGKSLAITESIPLISLEISIVLDSSINVNNFIVSITNFKLFSVIFCTEKYLGVILHQFQKPTEFYIRLKILRP